MKYTYPADDIADLVVPTLVAGTLEAGYPPENISNQNPALPFRTSTTTFRLVWDFLTAHLVAHVSLIHHNFSAGLTGVKFEMNATNVWTSPSFSRSFTIPAYHEDKFPANAALDLTDVNPTYRYASLVVSVANIVACSVGEFVIASTIRDFSSIRLNGSSSDDEDHPLIEHSTDVGVTTFFSYGTRGRWRRGQVTNTDAVITQLQSWNRSSQGRFLAFVIVDQETGEPLFVRFVDSKRIRSLVEHGVNSVALGFEEVSRGLIPTPSAV